MGDQDEKQNEEIKTIEITLEGMKKDILHNRGTAVQTDQCAKNHGDMEIRIMRSINDTKKCVMREVAATRKDISAQIQSIQLPPSQCPPPQTPGNSPPPIDPTNPAGFVNFLTNNKAFTGISGSLMALFLVLLLLWQIGVFA